jgi:hypothetical protein
MSDCKGFVDFETTHGTDAAVEVMERICDAHWQGKNSSDKTVTFSNVHTHNAANHTLSGTIEFKGVLYGFIIDNGDWAGTVVQEWGLAEEVGEYQAPEPAQYMFVPVDDNLKTKSPAMWGVYLSWKSSNWFKEKLAAYHYDRHFQPGVKVEDHYGSWAAKQGMKIVRVN